MPIFVYRCECGNRFERLVPRDATAPACPECGSATRKVPAGPSLGRGSTASPGRVPGPAGSVPIPWRGVASGGQEKLTREIEFRQRLEAKARAGIRTPGGPERSASDPGSTSSDAS